MFFVISTAIIVILCAIGILPCSGISVIFTFMVFIGSMAIQNDIDAMRK